MPQHNKYTVSCKLTQTLEADDMLEAMRLFERQKIPKLGNFLGLSDVKAVQIKGVLKSDYYIEIQ